MKGKNECVFSPHPISATNYKFSLIPTITLQVTNKIADRPIKSVEGKKF